MKIIQWSDDIAPDFTILENGNLEFYDYPDLRDFQINDEIHYKSRLGITVFKIVKVEPANKPGYSEDLRKVTAQWTN